MLFGGVLLDQRGGRAGVAEPGHEFLGGCALGRGERAAGVAQVVEMGTGHASGDRGLGPDLVEVAATEPAALRADEDEAMPPAFGVTVKAAPRGRSRRRLGQPSRAPAPLPPGWPLTPVGWRERQNQGPQNPGKSSRPRRI